MVLGSTSRFNSTSRPLLGRPVRRVPASDPSMTPTCAALGTCLPPEAPRARRDGLPAPACDPHVCKQVPRDSWRQLPVVLTDLDDALLIGEHGNLDPVTEPQFEQDACHMGLRGGLADDELGGDLGVG
jgi:hypothetical protein